MPGETPEAPNPADERRWLLIYLLILVLTVLVYAGLWAFSSYFSPDNQSMVVPAGELREDPCT